MSEASRPRCPPAMGYPLGGAGPTCPLDYWLAEEWPALHFLMGGMHIGSTPRRRKWPAVALAAAVVPRWVHHKCRADAASQEAASSYRRGGRREAEREHTMEESCGDPAWVEQNAAATATFAGGAASRWGYRRGDRRKVLGGSLRELTRADTGRVNEGLREFRTGIRVGGWRWAYGDVVYKILLDRPPSPRVMTDGKYATPLHTSSA